MFGFFFVFFLNKPSQKKTVVFRWSGSGWTTARFCNHTSIKDTNVKDMLAALKCGSKFAMCKTLSILFFIKIHGSLDVLDPDSVIWLRYWKRYKKEFSDSNSSLLSAPLTQDMWRCPVWSWNPLPVTSSLHHPQSSSLCWDVKRENVLSFITCNLL